MFVTSLAEGVLVKTGKQYPILVTFTQIFQAFALALLNYSNQIATQLNVYINSILRP